MLLLSGNRYVIEEGFGGHLLTAKVSSDDGGDDDGGHNHRRHKHQLDTYQPNGYLTKNCVTGEAGNPSL